MDAGGRCGPSSFSFLLPDLGARLMAGPFFHAPCLINRQALNAVRPIPALFPLARNLKWTYQDTAAEKPLDGQRGKRPQGETSAGLFFFDCPSGAGRAFRALGLPSLRCGALNAPVAALRFLFLSLKRRAPAPPAWLTSASLRGAQRATRFAPGAPPLGARAPSPASPTAASGARSWPRPPYPPAGPADVPPPPPAAPACPGPRDGGCGHRG